MSGEASSLTQEVDPITAAIDAVLANASVISTAVEKPKKIRRVKKRDQEGNAVTTQKQGAKTAADNVDENDDDSSTAGDGGGLYCCFWTGCSTLINIISQHHGLFLSLMFILTGESNKRRVATEEQVQFPLQHG